MTLEELRRSLPEELRVTELPPAIAEAFEYLVDRAAATDAGIPESQIPTVAEWRAGHGE